MSLGRTVFVLTEEHVTLLRNSNVNDELSRVEYGAAQIDGKRPYGNSDVLMDIASLLGVEKIETADGESVIRKEDGDRLERLHRETPTALQVVLASGSFTPGTYQTSSPYHRDWRLVEASS
jgi:hypothetical protein